MRWKEVKDSEQNKTERNLDIMDGVDGNLCRRWCIEKCEVMEKEDIKVGYHCPQCAALGAFSRDATVG
jgi:hypothetical protein